MISRKHIDVLRQIHDRLNDGSVNWVVTGSLGFALQGIPVVPDDIDIQTDGPGAYEIERRFPEAVADEVAFSASDRIRSHFGSLEIDGVRVEIMGDIEKRDANGAWGAAVDLQTHRRLADFEGMTIPVLSLEYECEAYMKLGRTERAGMLRRWLDRRPGPASCEPRQGAKK